MIPLPKIDLSGFDGKNITVTKEKIIYTLVVILAIFCCVKINSNTSLIRESLDSKAMLVLSSTKDIKNPEILDRAFSNESESGLFCGWAIKEQTGKIIYSSENFENTQLIGKVISKTFIDETGEKSFSVCFKFFDNLKSSNTRQIIFVSIISILIIFLVRDTTIYTDEKKDEISNS